MTADEIRSVVFQSATVGGYKKTDVDLFLEEVAVCVESMAAKIKALEKNKFENGEAESTPIAEPAQKVVAPVQKETTREGVTDFGIQTVLLRAQKLAEDIEAEARESANQLLEKSAEDANDIIARADEQAEATNEKANALLQEAQRKEQAINTAAREEAESIINDAVARSGQMLTSAREKLKKEQELCDKLRNEFTEIKKVITGFYEEQLANIENLNIDNIEKTDVSVVSEAQGEPFKEEISSDSKEAEESVQTEESVQVAEAEEASNDILNTEPEEEFDDEGTFDATALFNNEEE